MKTALLSALLLTGCASAPQTMPTSPATYTQLPQVARYNDCVDALSSVLALSRVSIPVLDKCFAGDRVQCNGFLLFRESIKPKLRHDDAIDCIESGAISPVHPLAVNIQQELPVFTKKLKRFNKKMEKGN